MDEYKITRVKGGTDNCYIVSAGKDAVLFDTSSKASLDMVLDALDGYDLKLIVLSHTHFDHAENAKVISDKFGVPVAYHRADDELFDDYDAQPLRSFGLVGFVVLKLSIKQLRETKAARPADPIFIKEGDTLQDYGFPDIKVIELPGHTRGSIGLLISGTFLLLGDAMDNWIRPSIGHLYWDMDVLKKTYDRIRSLGVKTIYYGHGKETEL